MQKHLLLLGMLLVFNTMAFSNPILLKNKYLIACLQNGSTGTVSLGNDTYNLIFLPDRDSEDYMDSDCWIIVKLESGNYAFQNASTLQYVRLQPDSSDRTALRMVDTLFKDGTTSWTLESKSFQNKSYYMIRNVYRPSKIWNKRQNLYAGVYPVGTYEPTGATLDYFLFYDVDGNPVDDDGGQTVTPPARTQSLGFLSNYFNTLTFNSKVPAVDTKNKKLFVTVPSSVMNIANAQLQVRYIPKKTSYTLYINGKAVLKETDNVVISMQGSQDVAMEVREGTNVLSSGKIAFSCLPFVQLFSDTTLNSTYALGRIIVSEPEKPDTAELLLANLKTRGAYAAKLEKKSFSIKLKYENGLTAIDRSFFGLRSDNNWVLDAMGIDKARMRNRVSTDFWNDFSTRPYHASAEPKMVNGSRGQFVEVFINDSYYGLYCMTEKVDRKQLNLKKFIPATTNTSAVQRGALFKVDNWSFESLMGNTQSTYYKAGQVVASYANTSETWRSYAIKYPDLGDGEPIDWKIMHQAVVLCSDFTSDAVFKANVEKQFDIPEIRDYYLFLELILAADNQGKNMYFATYDQSVSPMLFIIPWDLDATWGRRWNGTSTATGPSQDFDTFVDKYVQAQSNLFKRLKKLNVGGFLDQLPIRYRELRGSHFDYNPIMRRFQNYHALFVKSGAMNREITRWAGYSFAADIEFDLNFLSTWIATRINYLDKQYLGGPYVGLDATVGKQLSIYPNPAVDQCQLNGLHAEETVELFTLQGRKIRQLRSDQEQMQMDLSGLSPGIYLIRAGQRIVKLIKK